MLFSSGTQTLQLIQWRPHLTVYRIIPHPAKSDSSCDPQMLNQVSTCRPWRDDWHCKLYCMFHEYFLIKVCVVTSHCHTQVFSWHGRGGQYARVFGMDVANIRPNLLIPQQGNSPLERLTERMAVWHFPSCKSTMLVCMQFPKCCVFPATWRQRPGCFQNFTLWFLFFWTTKAVVMLPDSQKATHSLHFPRKRCHVNGD